MNNVKGSLEFIFLNSDETQVKQKGEVNDLEIMCATSSLFRNLSKDTREILIRKWKKENLI